MALSDMIDHPAAHGHDDDPSDAVIEQWIEDNAALYGVQLCPAVNPNNKRMLGWVATATRDGEPVGKESSWHSCITTAAAEGELMSDKLLRADARENANG